MDIPAKYERTPPRYESNANRLKYNIGSELFPAHAINISGGISPRIDSEAKKIVKIILAGNVSTIKENNTLKSITNLWINNIDIIIKEIGKTDFFILKKTKE